MEQRIMPERAATGSELSQNLQTLSEKAKSGTEFIQRLKKMADSVSGNCAEFEKTVIAQCDALMEVVKKRKEELLANVQEERTLKVTTLREQVSDCTALLHRTTGLLQYCIEVLKETDHSSFLQVSPGLINRVSMADINFNKEMELAPRISPEFELTVDNTTCIHTIQNMNFFQMKVSSGAWVRGTRGEMVQRALSYVALRPLGQSPGDVADVVPS
ncbi:hypothetical protein ACOMHN_027030 [Nucella lapillus]